MKAWDPKLCRTQPSKKKVVAPKEDGNGKDEALDKDEEDDKQPGVTYEDYTDLWTTTCEPCNIKVKGTVL